MKIIEGGVCAAKGFKAGALHCGIRKSQTKKVLTASAMRLPYIRKTR